MAWPSAEGLTSTKAVRLRNLQENEENRKYIPDAYVSHSECERKCNDHVELFRADFPKSLKDRLFLLPENEYGIKKFVCTYIQPTLLPNTELYDLRKCASFVARYCQHEPLENGSSLEIPIVSPAQTLEWAVGDCFDCSFLLASLLIGAGHDAFVVFGKAPEWIRRKDQSHMQCILSQRSGDEGVSIPWGMEVNVEDKLHAQKPNSNDGTHCWVLVKTGKRDLSDGDHYFVETSTGILYPICDSPYSQVLSIWNDRNCWLNVGDSSSVDRLGLSNRWMPVLPDAHSTPYSWVDPLEPNERFLIRYPPDGKRTINVNKAKVEFYGEGIDPQGLSCRVTQYEDVARTITLACNEIFFPATKGVGLGGVRTGRRDHMIQRIRRPLENMCCEYFSRESDVCEREEVGGKLRRIKFNEKARVDGLVERAEKFGSSITEHFLNRDILRRIICISPLPKDAKKPKSSDLVPITDKQLAVIERIDEHFKEPEDKTKLETSVASRSYLLKDRIIKVTYHCEHEVLRREDVYSKDNITNDFGKELIKLQNASMSAVKKTQAEIIQLTESKYVQETKMTENLASTSHASERKPTSRSKNDGVPSNRIENDYLSPYLQDETQGYLNKEEAMRVKSECLEETRDRLMERAKVIQSKLSREREEKDNAEADVSFRIELLEKRLAEHEKKAITKYKELEQKLNEDVRLTSLRESE